MLGRFSHASTLGIFLMRFSQSSKTEMNVFACIFFLHGVPIVTPLQQTGDQKPDGPEPEAVRGKSSLPTLNSHRFAHQLL